MSTNFVSYLRVSTQKQGASGLGLEAQQAAVQQFVQGRAGTILQEFVEVETGKGADALTRRPRLKEALDVAKRKGAVLVIAKLDRLARNVHFISGLMESGVEFVAADMPQANKTMIQIFAAMSEWEREQISARTAAAAKARMARGETYGFASEKYSKEAHEKACEVSAATRIAQADAFAENLRKTVDLFRKSNYSVNQMAEEFNKQGIKTARGGLWYPTTVANLIRRLDENGQLKRVVRCDKRDLSSDKKQAVA